MQYENIFLHRRPSAKLKNGLNAHLMKHSLQMKIGQQLAMTPQLQQAIKLLQLSTLELQTEIQQALESNPMLEVQEEGEDNPEKETAKMRSDNEKEAKESESSAEKNDDSIDGLDGIDDIDDMSASIEINDAAPDIPNELPAVSYTHLTLPTKA